MLLFFRARWLLTNDAAWLSAYRFWTKVFALSFALGVVSGITMSFQFGTNWPGFIEIAGNIAGPLLGYEVLKAFFLEASFLGVMLFGHGRVSERVHLAATLMVAFGTTLSAFWILSLNSWMQTPQGFEIINGEFHALDWWAVIFNPSFPYRLTHKLLASGLTVSFLLAGVSAWQLLKVKAQPHTARVLRVGLTLGAVLIPLQILVGHMHGLNTLKYQPAKIAAMEGVWQTEKGAPLLLFAWPNAQTRSNDYEIGIPKLASLVLTHHADGEIKGLDEFKGAHPPVAPLFFGFRIMVGTGLLMLAFSWGGFWLYKRRAWVAEALPRWLLRGLALVSIITPLLSQTVSERWFRMPELIALLPIPLMTALALLGLRALLNSHRILGKLCWLPFALMVLVLVMLMSAIGLAYSLYPYVLIDRLTVWQAAAAPKSLQFILWGVAGAVPAIAVYTVFAYRVFWGKSGALKYA